MSKISGLRLSPLNLGVFIPALSLAGWLPKCCYIAVLSCAFGGSGSLRILQAIDIPGLTEPANTIMFRQQASRALLDAKPALVGTKLETSSCACKRQLRGSEHKEVAWEPS